MRIFSAFMGLSVISLLFSALAVGQEGFPRVMVPKFDATDPRITYLYRACQTGSQSVYRGGVFGTGSFANQTEYQYIPVFTTAAEPYAMYLPPTEKGWMVKGHGKVAPQQGGWFVATTDGWKLWAWDPKRSEPSPKVEEGKPETPKGTIGKTSSSDGLADGFIRGARQYRENKSVPLDVLKADLRLRDEGIRGRVQDVLP